MASNPCLICGVVHGRNSAILVTKDESLPICEACYDEKLMPAIKRWRGEPDQGGDDEKADDKS